MQTKKEERYDIMESKEVYNLFVLIISQKGILFKELRTKADKSKTSVSLQIKPLVTNGLIIKEGTGKKNNPLILKGSKKGLINFLLKYKLKKEEIELYINNNKYEMAVGENPNCYIDLSTPIFAARTFSDLLYHMEHRVKIIKDVYLF